MTEINTDEIRAGLQGDDHPSTEAEIRALCDALDEARRDTRDMDEYDARWFALHAELDATRAELDDLDSMVSTASQKWHATLARAEAAEAELAASERWRHDTAVERDYEVGRRIAAEARIAELEADITVIDDLASGDRAQMRAYLKHAETVSSNLLNKVDEMEARIAAALAVVAAWDEWDREPVRRALIEGTGQ